MERQPEWNEYEAALLLEGTLEVLQGSEKRAVVIQRVSKQLRQMALNRGKDISETYRNDSGIHFQLYSMESAVTGSVVHGKPATKLFQNVVQHYKNDPAGFDNLLKEAKVMSKSTFSHESFSSQTSGREVRLSASDVQTTKLVTALDFENYVFDTKSGQTYSVSHDIRELNDNFGKTHALLSVPWEESFYNLNYLRVSASLSVRQAESLRLFDNYLCRISPRNIDRGVSSISLDTSYEMKIRNTYEIFLKKKGLAQSLINDSVQSILQLQCVLKKANLSTQVLFTKERACALNTLLNVKGHLSAFRLNNFACRRALAFFEAFLNSEYYPVQSVAAAEKKINVSVQTSYPSRINVSVPVKTQTARTVSVKDFKAFLQGKGFSEKQSQQFCDALLNLDYFAWKSGVPRIYFFEGFKKRKRAGILLLRSKLSGTKEYTTERQQALEQYLLYLESDTISSNELTWTADPKKQEISGSEDQKGENVKARVKQTVSKPVPEAEKPDDKFRQWLIKQVPSSSIRTGMLRYLPELNNYFSANSFSGQNVLSSMLDTSIKTVHYTVMSDSDFWKKYTSAQSDQIQQLIDLMEAYVRTVKPEYSEKINDALDANTKQNIAEKTAIPAQIPSGPQSAASDIETGIVPCEPVLLPVDQAVKLNHSEKAGSAVDAEDIKQTALIKKDAFNDWLSQQIPSEQLPYALNLLNDLNQHFSDRDFSGKSIIEAMQDSTLGADKVRHVITGDTAFFASYRSRQITEIFKLLNFMRIYVKTNPAPAPQESKSDETALSPETPVKNTVPEAEISAAIRNEDNTSSDLVPSMPVDSGEVLESGKSQQESLDLFKKWLSSQFTPGERPDINTIEVLNRHFSKNFFSGKTVLEVMLEAPDDIQKIRNMIVRDDDFNKAQRPYQMMGVYQMLDAMTLYVQTAAASSPQEETPLSSDSTAMDTNVSSAQKETFLSLQDPEPSYLKTNQGEKLQESAALVQSATPREKLTKAVSSAHGQEMRIEKKGFQDYLKKSEGIVVSGIASVCAELKNLEMLAHQYDITSDCLLDTDVQQSRRMLHTLQKDPVIRPKLTARHRKALTYLEHYHAALKALSGSTPPRNFKQF